MLQALFRRGSERNFVDCFQHSARRNLRQNLVLEDTSTEFSSLFSQVYSKNDCRTCFLDTIGSIEYMHWWQYCRFKFLLVGYTPSGAELID
jgi:hypothetical protein